MAKITVELEAFYGYSCGFQSHGSNETVELEISENELDALNKLCKEQITAEDIVAAIESGETTLKSLHEQLSEKFYYMVEEYWLYEADNECLEESLSEYIEQDIADGLYIPEISKRKRRNECGYDLDAYYDWVCEGGHDHAFVAERVGLNLDACREDEVNYTIQL